LPISEYTYVIHNYKYRSVKRIHQKAPGIRRGLIGFRCRKLGLHLDVLGLRALVALHDLELDRVTFLQ
jgi:hypothetical protein